MTEETKNENTDDAVEEKKEQNTPADAVSSDEKPKEVKGEKPAPDSSVKKEETPEDEGTDVEVPAKFKDIVDAIEKMSVLDLNELVKLFEKKFGVSAAAVAVAGVGAVSDEEEGSSKVTVELTSVGDSKVAVIKIIKEILGVGLKEAKELTDAAPSEIKKDIEKAEADEIKAKIEEVGGTVTIK